VVAVVTRIQVVDIVVIGIIEEEGGGTKPASACMLR
jgi:hypothetical protein